VKPIFFFKQTFSLCEDLLLQSHERCPITRGEHTIKTTTSIDNKMPHGSYIAQCSIVTDPPSSSVLRRDIHLEIR
jgi:hypothetical protein